MLLQEGIIIVVKVGRAIYHNNQSEDTSLVGYR